MIVFIAMIFGALWGVVVARRAKGNRLDVLQYAAGFGIAAGLLTFFAVIAFHHLII